MKTKLLNLFYYSISAIISIVINGTVIMLAYNWFIAPFYNIEEIGLQHGSIMFILCSYAINRQSTNTKSETELNYLKRVMSDNIVRAIFIIILLYITKLIIN